MLNITFVALGSEQLAISLLANMARREGHNVQLAFNAALFHDRFNLEIPWLNKIFDDTPYTIQAIKEQNPDVLVFSVLTATYQWMLEIARKSKKMFPDVKVIFGGVHPSAVPEIVLGRPEVDYVVVGEGEVCFIEILAAIESGNDSSPIPNTRFKNSKGEVIKGPQQPFYQALDTLPPFTKELWEDHIFIPDHYITMASRGCPYRCTFCFNNFYAELPDDKKTKGKYVRTRSVDHMLDELKYVKSRYKNVKWIDFEDDIFTVNKSWLKEFLPRYKKEIGIPFQCLTHPRYMDEEIAEWLVDAGCRWVQMGIQTMDDGFKIQNLRRNERSDHIEKSLKVMLAKGLLVKVDHMFGLPGEPIEAQERARELYAEYCPARIQTFWTCFLPGTELLEQGLREGIVTPQEADRVNNGEDFYFFRNPENIKNPELVRMYHAYEFLFKIYPILPKFIRKALKAKHVAWVPAVIKNGLSFVAELINAVSVWNPNFIVYAKYYLFHMWVLGMRKLGFKRKFSAVHPVNKTMYDFSQKKKYVAADLVEEDI